VSVALSFIIEDSEWKLNIGLKLRRGFFGHFLSACDEKIKKVYVSDKELFACSLYPGEHEFVHNELGLPAISNRAAVSESFENFSAIMQANISGRV
jgi:hypothetical protein